MASVSRMRLKKHISEMADIQLCVKRNSWAKLYTWLHKSVLRLMKSVELFLVYLVIERCNSVHRFKYALMVLNIFWATGFIRCFNITMSSLIFNPQPTENL